MSYHQPEHPFLRAPHRTFFSLSLPVLFSLIAEPLTGLVDTAFISRLGSDSLAALGVGAMVLSGVFWIFNFLGIGTQTEVSQAQGRQDPNQAIRMSSLAIMLSFLFGLLLAVSGLVFAAPVARMMGAVDAVQRQAITYMQLRLFGAPAVLVTIAAFGTLRGLQEMRMPLRVALGINAINIFLDAVLIFGMGPVPPLGVAGAALASAASQWVGAIWSCYAVYARLGLPDRLLIRDAKKLLRIGRDLFVRTGLLTLFLLLATRAATRIGPEAGAAHQAIRQVWIFANLFLDAFSITALSLVGYFIGAGQVAQARRVAAVVCLWGVSAGFGLTLVMLLGRSLAAAAFVPPVAFAFFTPAWFVAALAQPISALSFVTDGIHWGTGDYRYLRNVVTLATFCGGMAIIYLDEGRSGALTWIWVITAGWIIIRALFGVLRVWPGIGKSPLTAKKP
jgi:MATE family multidrug resistance protein